MLAIIIFGTLGMTVGLIDVVCRLFTTKISN